MYPTIHQVGRLRSEIEMARPSIRAMKSEWYSDLISNLRKLNQIAKYLLDYLATTIEEPSMENLILIHGDLTFIWRVLKEDVIDIQPVLIKKHPSWKIGVKIAESLYRVDLLNVIHSIRDYIQLHEKASGKLTKTARDDQRHIKPFSEQWRIATDMLIIFQDKFVKFLNSVDNPIAQRYIDRK